MVNRGEKKIRQMKKFKHWPGPKEESWGSQGWSQEEVTFLGDPQTVKREARRRVEFFGQWDQKGPSHCPRQGPF